MKIHDTLLNHIRHVSYAATNHFKQKIVTFILCTNLNSYILLSKKEKTELIKLFIEDKGVKTN